MAAAHSTSKSRGGFNRIDGFKKSTEFREETGFRSPLEKKVAEQLVNARVYYAYERERIAYTVPERLTYYLPDFKVGSIFIECKGWPFEAEDRQKMILVKKQNPAADIRIVFQNANQKIYSGSKTTVKQWAEQHGFPWSDKGVIPSEWLKEVTNG